MDLRRIVITCGGTGGHFYPGLSIAREFKAQGGEVELLLSGVNSAAQAQVAERFGIPAVQLPLMPSWHRPQAFLKGLLGGFWQSLSCLRRFAPQAVIGMGSFASLPTALAAKCRGVPLILHDGNARIGWANRYLSWCAKFLGAGFPPVNRKSCHCPVVECGMPVRPELEAARTLGRGEALAWLNSRFGTELEESRRTILIFGGSQGAAVFNEVLPRALLKRPETDFQVLHLCGRGKKSIPEELYLQAKFPVLLLESDENMQYFLAAADVVFARSGGSTVAELALFGKAAALIPYPYAAEDHQSDNARHFSAAGAGVLIPNAGFSVEKAGELVADFLHDQETWHDRSRRALALARPGSAAEFLKAVSAAVGTSRA